MQLLYSSGELDRYRQTVSGKVAFVPTMGALHQGHLSLVQLAQQQASCVGVSIFVNPAQFAPHEDFDSYPRSQEEDIAKLAALDVDFVYLPDVPSIYPQGMQSTYSTGALGQCLEGVVRPHFFDGVALVVSELFRQVKPETAVFGEKDYQQLLVIRQMVKDLSFAIEIVGAPIMREADGLAMSSRNRYLNESQRAVASLLYATLQEAKQRLLQQNDVHQVLDWATQTLLAKGFSQVDYISLCDDETLVPLDQNQGQARLLAAASIGEVRLIDNLAVSS